MQQNTNKVKRNYSVRDGIMLTAATTITETALANVLELEEIDTTLNTVSLSILQGTISNVISGVFGSDNAAQMRAKTIELDALHDSSLKELGHTKTLIENKYSGNRAQRDELLTTLGFTGLYASAADGTQDNMSKLLHRFIENLTPGIQTDLIAKGLPPARINRLLQNSIDYQRINSQQEGFKDQWSVLTDQDITQLNTIYGEVIAICKTAQRIYKSGSGLHNSFVFDQVTAQQSSYHTGGEKEEPLPAQPE